MESVIFVHGTFAYQENEVAKGGDDRRWWQRNSSFCRALTMRISPRVCAPVGNPILAVRAWWWGLVPHRWRPSDSNPKPEGVFHWSGDNSGTARESAAKLLLKHLRQFENLNQPYHVVAHSHGGRVLWETLCLAKKEAEKSNNWAKLGRCLCSLACLFRRSRCRAEKSLTEPLPKLKTWTTVATPYIHFRPNYGG